MRVRIIEVQITKDLLYHQTIVRHWLTSSLWCTPQLTWQPPRCCRLSKLLYTRWRTTFNCVYTLSFQNCSIQVYSTCIIDMCLYDNVKEAQVEFAGSIDGCWVGFTLNQLWGSFLKDVRSAESWMSSSSEIAETWFAAGPLVYHHDNHVSLFVSFTSEVFCQRSLFNRPLHNVITMVIDPAMYHFSSLTHIVLATPPAGY